LPSFNKIVQKGILAKKLKFFAGKSSKYAKKILLSCLISTKWLGSLI